MRPVVLLVNSLEGGGAERVVCYIANKMTDEKVYLVVLDDKEPVYELADHVDFQVLGVSNYLKASFCFAKWLKEHAEDAIVISFLNRSNYVNILSNIFHKHITLLSERNTVSKHFFKKGFYGTLNKLLIKAIYKYSHKIIAVSDGVKVDLVENYDCDSSLITVINNPVDCESIAQRANDEVQLPESIGRYVCSVGRLNAQKRFDVLIKAFSKVDDSLALVILGEGELRHELQNLIEELGLVNRVYLLGFQSNPYSYVKNSDIFVLSSDYEGFPNALLEALAIGKAVISTNCKSGPSDILGSDQRYGLLVPTGNETEMANAINKLNADEELRKTYEDLARNRVADNYNIESVVASYRNCICEFKK